jgi:hypothetical protein
VRPFDIAKLNLGAKLCRSELAQKIGANDLAESVMAFNTNYSDAGLFGVYAVAKVCCLHWELCKQFQVEWLTIEQILTYTQ